MSNFNISDLPSSSKTLHNLSYLEPNSYMGFKVTESMIANSRRISETRDGVEFVHDRVKLLGVLGIQGEGFDSFAKNGLVGVLATTNDNGARSYELGFIPNSFMGGDEQFIVKSLFPTKREQLSFVRSPAPRKEERPFTGLMSWIDSAIHGPRPVDRIPDNNEMGVFVTLNPLDNNKDVLIFENTGTVAAKIKY